MDNLQWFKFSYADWRIGKIQRCPEVTQARFINLCCLYWSKECELSYEDAEIEIDEEHLNILIKKKIVSNIDDFINISFLDEQFAEIGEKKSSRSDSGIKGNLKRWHKPIYDKYIKKLITLEEAIKLSKEVANQSHSDSNTITTQSQSIADKSREEKRRKDIENTLNSESVKMANEKYLNAFSLKVKDYSQEVDKFVTHIEATGEIDRHIKKIKPHFTNWLKIQVEKNKPKGNKANNSSLTQGRNLKYLN